MFCYVIVVVFVVDVFVVVVFVVVVVFSPICFILNKSGGLTHI